MGSPTLQMNIGKTHIHGLVDFSFETLHLWLTAFAWLGPPAKRCDARYDLPSSKPYEAWAFGGSAGLGPPQR